MKQSLPFTIQNVFQGLAESEGMLSVDGTDLKLEFQTTDSVVGLLKSGVRKVRLPLETIQEISFRKGWFGCSLVIRVAEMRLASEVPNFKQGEIALSIARKHGKTASDLVSSIQFASRSKPRR